MTTIRQYAAPDAYLLPSDEIERQRLVTQHDIVKRLFDGQLALVPEQDLDLQGDIKVLDAGTGAGVWAIDFAQSHPHAQVTAFDLSSNLFPSSHPANVTFRELSLLELPKEWVGTFDFVQQRLLRCALTIPQWHTALENLKLVMKPGGWIQLAETGARGWPLLPVPESASARFHVVYKAIFDARDLAFMAAEVIASILEKLGYQNIKVVNRNQNLGLWAGEEGEKAKQNLGGVFRAVKPGVMEKGGFGVVRSGDDFDILIDDLCKEWDMHEGTYQEWSTVIAQKPT